MIQSWDRAAKSGPENDFSVGTTWGVTPTGFFLLSLFRAKLEFPQLKQQIASQRSSGSRLQF